MNIPQVRIVHETNPEKYFPALYDLHGKGLINIRGAYRYSVVKEFFRSIIRDKKSPLKCFYDAWHDLGFRLFLGRIRGETIILGFAPWDWRILIYNKLCNENKIIYHTSWHDWELNATPRQPPGSILKSYLQSKWKGFLNHPNVSIVAVTPVVRRNLQETMQVDSTVIPHAVPSVFYDAREKRKLTRVGSRESELKLLFVGEISEKKGMRVLLKLMESVADLNVSLTIVGNGPLQSEITGTSLKINYLGSIYERSRLAEVMANHDILMLLSQRTEKWEELFGIVIIEALAAGCSVIASKHIGPGGILPDKVNNGLFDEKDLKGVVEFIRAIQLDRATLSKLFQAQDISKLYSIERVTESWYSEILS